MQSKVNPTSFEIDHFLNGLKFFLTDLLILLQRED